jgi:septum formation protein
MGIILASASPRRRELLELLGVKNLKIMPADTDETVAAMSPEAEVQAIALEKAKAVAAKSAAADVVVAADTLVYLEGEALAKPADDSDAFRMLRQLSGARHTVYTGVALVQGNRELTFAEKTDVYFRKLTDAEIHAYIQTGEPMDKAGAYGAQGRGAMFIERIDGDFFNVVGLPLCRLVVMLRRFGIDLAGEMTSNR